MAPGSIFHHISFRSTILQSFTFRSINQKPQKYLLYRLFSFIYLYQIWPLQVTVKGLTTPFRVGWKLFDCLCRYWWFVRCLLLDWYLGSQTEGNTCYLLSMRWFSLEEERVMQQSRDKYYPQLENQGVNPVGDNAQITNTFTKNQTLAANTIKGLSIPSRSLAKVRSDRDR